MAKKLSGLEAAIAKMRTVQPPSDMPMLGKLAPKKWHELVFDVSAGFDEIMTGPEVDPDEDGSGWPAYQVTFDDEVEEVPFWARKSFYEEIITPIASGDLELDEDGQVTIKFRRLVDDEAKNLGEFRTL